MWVLLGIVVFAVIAKDDAREQLRAGGVMFGGFLLARHVSKPKVYGNLVQK